MRPVHVVTAFGLAVAGIFGVVATDPSPAMAANARHPYSNIDKRVDKGGDTGDSQVERLNQQQLDSARAQNGMAPQPGMLGAPLMPQTAPATGLGR